MPLHDREAADAILDPDIYSVHAADIPYQSSSSARPVCHRMSPRPGQDELFLDATPPEPFNFCQTWLDPEVHELMDLSIDKNMIDKDEYPATAEIEKRCVNILADLWNSPEAAHTIGCSTTAAARPACSADWRSNGNGVCGWRPRANRPAART